MTEKAKIMQVEKFIPLDASNPSVPKPVPQVDKNEESIFFEITKLPTNGRFYPVNTIIKARPMKVLEVKMLSQMTPDTADSVVNEVIKRTVRGINVEDLYSSDKLYIIFWLRANTYAESGFEIEYDCPHCKANSTYNFNLDSLSVKHLEDSDIGNMDKGLKLNNGDTVTFKFLTVKDEQENVEFLKRNKKSLMNFDQETLATCKMIDEINGEKLGMTDKYIYLTEKLTPVDYTYVESYIQDVSVGLEPVIDVKCNKCGVTSNTALPFRPDFFLPKIETRRGS